MSATSGEGAKRPNPVAGRRQRNGCFDGLSIILLLNKLTIRPSTPISDHSNPFLDLSG